MSAKGAAEALLTAVQKRDIAAVATATKGGKIDVVPLDLKGASSSKAKEYFEALFTSFPDLEVEVVSQIVAGDNALLDVVLSGTPKEPYLDIAIRDGKTLRSRQAWRIEANGETVSSLRVYFCSNELKWSLGANKTYAEAIAGARA
jgi:hypothetical protein